jgi:hypothetical protein
MEASRRLISFDTMSTSVSLTGRTVKKPELRRRLWDAMWFSRLLSLKCREQRKTQETMIYVRKVKEPGYYRCVFLSR